MIKDAIAKIPEEAGPDTFSGGVACNRNSKSIIHRILNLMFASDVPLRCLHRSVAKQKRIRSSSAPQPLHGRPHNVIPSAANATTPKPPCWSSEPTGRPYGRAARFGRAAICGEGQQRHQVILRLRVRQEIDCLWGERSPPLRVLAL